MSNIRVKAPAKVNLLLRVVGRRDDGYHDLEMVMVPLSLADELEVEEASSGIELVVDGARDKGMVGERNLAWRAAAAMQAEAGRREGVRIRLQKRIPVAAGLGGGSSDAAAVLRALNLLWGLSWPPERLAEIGGSLGADVPFFCFGRPAYVEGIGDRVRPYEHFPNLLFLLINPGFPVLTPWVYRQWDLQLTPKKGDVRVRPLFQTFRDVISSLHNDLEAVTIPAHPELFEIKKFFMDAGAQGALMSGSGPTVFGVFESEGVRGAALEELRGHPRWKALGAESVAP